MVTKTLVITLTNGDAVSVVGTVSTKDYEVGKALASLEKGEAVVYKDGEGKTVIIPFHAIKDYTLTTGVSDEAEPEVEDDFCKTETTDTEEEPTPEP